MLQVEIKAFFDDMMVKNGLTDTKPTVASVSVGPKVTFIEVSTVTCSVTIISTMLL